MQTKLSALAAKLAESGWLVAVALVPIFFNPQTVRIFEEEKVALLRSIALLIVVALLVLAVEKGWGELRRSALRCWRLPLVKPALVLGFVYLASAALSIAPSVSFWGAYIRCQGTYTWLSYVTVFIAVVWLVRQREQLDRVVTVVLLASVPPTAYGVIQHFGGDFVAWGADVSARVHSTAGNPIFLAAYLIMVVPLTLVRVIEQLADLVQLNRRATPGRLRFASVLLFSAYVLLLLFQLLTIVYSQSRGPFIGLGVGLTYFFIVFALHRRLRWLTVSTAALVSAGALFLLIFNLPRTPLAPLHEVPYVSRLGNLFDVAHGTGKVRVLIWQGATELLAANPLRALIGYGPETMFLAYTPFYPPELAHYESRGASPDRSHNETFDALITIGSVGLVAQLLVFLSFFRHVLQWLGMINTARQRRAFFSAALLGAAIGTAMPYLADGSFRFSGVGLAAGMAAGLMLYLITHALSQLARVEWRLRQDDILLIGLLAAVMAHFVEINFGIAIAVTRLYFWLYAGLAIAIGVPLVRTKGPESTTADPRPGQTLAQTEPLLSGNLITVSPFVGLILVTLTFSFYKKSVDPLTHIAALLGLFAGVWLVGAFLIAVEPGRRRDWIARLFGYTATTLGISLLFAALYLSWVDWSPAVREWSPATVFALGSRQANVIVIFYAFVFSILAFNAVVAVLRERPLPERLTRRPGWQLLFCPALLAAAAAAIVATNLNNSRADAFSKQGTFYELLRQWDAAAIVYKQARQLRPMEDRYAVSLGRVFVEKARQDLRRQPPERERYMADAVAVMQRAWQISPLNTDHPRNLAKAHRTWATLSDDPGASARHVEKAEAYYQDASRLSPNNAALWSEWATLYLENGKPHRAVEILDRSLEIDPRYTTTHWLRAKAHLAVGSLEQALADYERALAINPELLPALSGKAVVLARLNRVQEAIEASRQALAVEPDDLISRRNLALLYRQTGKLDAALREAQAALAIAKVPEKPPLEAFIEELEAQSVAVRKKDATRAPGGNPTD